MMNCIDRANFSDANAVTDAPGQGTQEYIRSSDSERSVTGVIQLSSFRRGMLLNASQKIETFYLNLSANDIRGIVLEELFSSDQTESDNFLRMEGHVLQKLRDVSKWHFDKMTALTENVIQVMVQLYLRGLLESANLKLNVSPANGERLECKVLVESNVLKLKGSTDIRVGKFDGIKIGSCDDIIGEMKSYGGALEADASCNAVRGQLLGQLFTLHCMRRCSDSSKALSRGFLTDLRRIMIVFGFKQSMNDTHQFVVSSLVQETDDYICHLMFILMGRNGSHVGQGRSLHSGVQIGIDTDDSQVTYSNRIDGVGGVNPFELGNHLGRKTRKDISRKNSGNNKSSQLRPLQVIDLNAGDREAEREARLRFIYEHDALSNGFLYLSKQNVENHGRQNKAHFFHT